MLAERYQLLERLAVGGMGTVHVAVDERLGRRVAVKELKPELAADQAFVERFRREAFAAAALKHPNIAQVYDYGRDGERHFIVMELIDGIDVEHLLRERGRLSPPEAVRIATQVCGALAAAHAAGIVHRDVKPGNVIVAESGEVKVTDFGIARTRGDAPLTQTGTVLGTAQYVSPEQARGEAATPASDVYSLGVVLYQLLTGTVPFTAESPVAVALRHIHEPVPPPSLAVPDIPPSLDEVVGRATAKDPVQRFDRAERMATALEQALSGVPATAVLPAAPPQAPPSGPRRFFSRPRLLAALAGLTVLATLLILALGPTLGPGSAPGPGASRGPTARPASPSPDPGGVAGGDRDGDRRASRPSIPAGVVGRDVKAVEEVLKERGHEVETADADSTRPKDTVLATFPGPGETLTPGQPVVLIASRGDAPEDASSFVVPTGIVGADARDVERALKERDIKVEKVSVNSGRAKETVLRTYPAPGARAVGEKLILVVASGDPPR